MFSFRLKKFSLNSKFPQRLSFSSFLCHVEILKLNVTSERPEEYNEGDELDDVDAESLEYATDNAVRSLQNQQPILTHPTSLDDPDHSNVRNVARGGLTDKLPNGRIPSFERAEGAAN